MMEMMLTTKHAGKRMKERLKIKSKARQERMANLALERGEFKEFEERTFAGNSVTNMILEYQNRRFVFGKDKQLITVLPLQKKHHRSKYALLKEAAKEDRNRELRYA